MSDDDMDDGGEVSLTPPKKSKAVPLMLGLNTILIVGVLIFAMRKPATAVVSGPAAAPAKTADEKGEGSGGSDDPAHPGEDGTGPTVKLENFIIQLRTLDTDRYVRISLDLELGNEADKTIVNARTSRIRDAIIAYFSDRTVDELRGSEGLEHTKATLLKRLGEIVPGRHIKGVFVTDLVIQ